MNNPRESLVQIARIAFGALTGPERVEVIRHYLGSAKKAMASVEPAALCENCSEPAGRCECEDDT